MPNLEILAWCVVYWYLPLLLIITFVVGIFIIRKVIRIAIRIIRNEAIEDCIKICEIELSKEAEYSVHNCVSMMQLMRSDGFSIH